MSLVSSTSSDYIVLFTIGLFIFFSFFTTLVNLYKKNTKYNNHVKNKEILLIEEAGEEGERYVASMLSTIPKSYLINSFTFENDKGYSSNIDHLLINSAGIFVVETKANKGRIVGSPEKDTWTVYKNNSQKKELANPIMQNYSHLNHLKKLMGNNAPKMYSLIIFPFADISEVKKYKICNCGSARGFIESRMKYGKYDNYKVLEIYKKLVDIRNTYGISLDKHIDNINKMNRF